MRDSEIDARWCEVFYYREGGAIEKVHRRVLPFVPTYFSGIYARLEPVKDAAGKVTDVKVSYPRDFLAQQLEFARLNGTLGF